MSWNSRTNRISIKWVNHNGWIDIFVRREKKKNLFLFIFSTYLPVFLLKFRSVEVFGWKFWFYIQGVPTLHTFNRPRYPKNKKYLKNMMMTSSSHFLGISCFWGSEVHQKYAVWVLVGCGIKFHIQQALIFKIWVKTQGDMSKIRTKKVVFLLWYLSPNLY